MNTSKDLLMLNHAVAFEGTKIFILIQDLDNANPGYDKDKYLYNTWDTFLVIYHQY